ncbi:MAG: hypothetical protein COU51_05060 [Parcubacteria group bacterium CG10_big_fil_rev_8_21_14_0_10_36_14]|nr:MAG: hypothetical protein COU51_05060 [Parcubacteria group bacterium CG10_big_fil_rev_8_21_14_0_10_36_14]
MKCELCGCELILKNEKQYGTSGAECHISRHHFFPKRFLKLFDKKEIKKYFNIEDKNEKAVLCYDCHEEMIHNIVLTPQIIKKFGKKMKNKNIKERIVILYKQLLK